VWHEEDQDVCPHRRLGRFRRGERAVLRERLHLLRGAVPDEDISAGLEQSRRDPHAHRTETTTATVIAAKPST
jgi:hypothetical protein